ncbi:MAG: HAD-IC family P-type ATPase [Balneolaceae bacterium]|nr:HAD-IC family P-type ATPase [Balneolaceae bacterium]
MGHSCPGWRIFVVGWLSGKEIYQLVQTSIAWTIAAIPEGLPIVASIALARGMLRLADHNVIVKRLAAVETLGETTAIFTDKTGTLTENQLTLKTVDFPGIRMDVEWENGNHEPRFKNSKQTEAEINADDERLKRFFEIAVLCNDANLETPQEAAEEVHPNGEASTNGTGDPLDQALLRFGSEYNGDLYKKLRDQRRLDEEPFDSEDMVMGTIYEIDGKVMLLCKGAPEAILQRCTRMLNGQGNAGFTDEDRERWIDRNEELSEEGLRVIAVAFQELNRAPDDHKDVEEDLMHELTFLGLTGFIDPPRETVKEAVNTCHQAGISVEMLTGDHPGTARNIARQVNLVDEQNDQALRGSRPQ